MASLTVVRGLRLLVVLAIGTIVVPVAGLLAALDVAGARYAALPCAAAFGALAGAFGLLAVTSAWPAVRRWVTWLLVGAGAVFGLIVADLAPPTVARLRDTAIAVAEPRWRLQTSQGSYGSCFDSCSSFEAVYVTDDRPPVVLRHVRRAIPEHEIMRFRGYVFVYDEGADDVDVSVTLRASARGTRVEVLARAA